MDRPVLIDTSKSFPGLTGAPRRDEVSMWVKAGGLSISGPSMPGRQIAWIRRANDAAWVAVCELPVRSGNGHSRTTMQLWLESGMISPIA